MNEQQRKNTLIIKSVLEKKIAENFDTRYLNVWESNCGTHRCVGGDVFLAMYPGKSIFYGAPHVRCVTQDFEVFRAGFSKLFGFNKYFYIRSTCGTLRDSNGDVFGSDDEGTLQQRLDYVNSILGEEA